MEQSEFELPVPVRNFLTISSQINSKILASYGDRRRSEAGKRCETRLDDPRQTIDDPLKPDEALSESQRKAVNDWYDSGEHRGHAHQRNEGRCGHFGGPKCIAD